MAHVRAWRPVVTAPSAALQSSTPPSVTALLPLLPGPLPPANVALLVFVIRSLPLPPLPAPSRESPCMSRILAPHPSLCSGHSPPFLTHP